MKITLTTLFLFHAVCSFAQIDTSTFYESRNNILEVHGEKVYCYTYQIYPSTFIKQSGYVLVDSAGSSADFIKSSKGITYNNVKYKQTSNTYAKYDLLDDYWENKEIELGRQVNSIFPNANCINTIMIHKGYYEDWNWEDSNENCVIQRKRIDEYVQHEKDSLLEIHAVYSAKTNEFLNGVPSADLESLKGFLPTILALSEGGSGYYSAIFSEIAESNPALFYTYMETVPKDYRYSYFSLLDNKHYQMLKKFDTNSPVQRELKKMKRGDAWSAVAGVTVSLAELGGITWGIIYLVNRSKD